MLIWTVDNEWFDLIVEGKKTIEGRLPKFGVEKLEINEKVLIVDYRGSSIIVSIEEIEWFPTIKVYLEKHIKEALPGYNIEEGLNIYKRYISEKTEKSMGIVAIKIKFESIQS